MSIDASSVLARVLPKLNAAVSGDLVFWTTDELYRYMDEAQKRISRRGVHGTVESSAAVATAVSNLPSDHATTIAVLWNGTALRPSNVADLEAIDDSWQATSGTPARYIEDDDQGVRRVRVYPAPASPGALTLIYFQVPTALSASQTSSPLCRALDSYLLLRTVEAARLKECKGAMPEVSQAITTIAEQVESAALALWK